MSTLTFLATALLAFGVPDDAGFRPQGDRSFCGALFADLQVGAAARWELEGPEGVATSMTLGVAGRETRDGETYWWIETVLPMPSGAGRLLVQRLVPGFPFRQDDVEEFLMQLPGQLPRSVPKGGEPASPPGENWESQCRDPENEYLGVETTELDGVGSFEAHHLRGPDGTEIYLSESVPFGMLMMDGPEGVIRLASVHDDYEPELDRSEVRR